MTTTSKTYFENLNSLRFLAFLSVFTAHSFATTHPIISKNEWYTLFSKYTNLGVLGVNFFFVLSGFLITYLLLKERQHQTKISIKNFYARRVLRIWPLYFLMLIIGFVVLDWIKGYLGQEYDLNANLIYYLTFTVNFDIIKNSVPYFPVLGILWTISIEEQFYVAWPILTKISRWNIPILSLLIVICSIVFRALNIDDGPTIYFHTLSVMSDIGIGSFMGYIAFSKTRLFDKLSKVPKYFIAIVYGSIPIIILFYHHFPHSNWGNIIERTLWGLLFAFIIFEQSFSNNSLFKLGKVKWMDYLGRISYGLYCYHTLSNLILWQFVKQGVLPNGWLGTLLIYPLLSLLVTIILSMASYHYFEQPILKLKRHFK